MATIYQVSELAGVSLATVSRVMNNSVNVSDKTKAKVQAAMDQLGYKPNSIAQSLASSRTNSVGVLVSEFAGPFFGSMMQGIETTLREAHKHVIIAAGHSEETKEQEGIEFLISKKCDALILHVEAVSNEYLLELSKGSTPIILVNRHIDAISERCISLNNELGGYLATKHLVEQGHKSFAYISGPERKCDSKDRFRGHQRALAEAGLEQNPNLTFTGDFSEPSGADGMSYLLSQTTETNPAFTALVCANDIMASGAINVAREHHISIPDDVSIIGYDNVMFASYIYPKLSTINYPIYEMGSMAAKVVLQDIYKDKNCQVQNIFMPEIIHRDSVKTIS